LTKQDLSPALRASLAGFLAWLVPGLGHIYLGYRARGLIFLVTITATFWSGVAIGGVAGTVNRHQRRLWFVAQIGAGGQTLAAAALTDRVLPTLPLARKSDRRLDNQMRRSDDLTNRYLGDWSAAEVGVHYTGVAGLLNLLVIIDAISRADPSNGRRKQNGQLPQGGS